MIGEIRSIMARVGIASLQPDLVVLDEFQRFKDLLQPEPDNFAADLAHRLFDYSGPRDRPRHPDAAALGNPVPHVHDGRSDRRQPLRGLPRHLFVPVSGLGASRPAEAPLQRPPFGAHFRRVAQQRRGDLRQHRGRVAGRDGTNRAVGSHAGPRRNAPRVGHRSAGEARRSSRLPALQQPR